MKKTFSLLMLSLIFLSCEEINTNRTTEASRTSGLTFQIDKKLETVYFAFMLSGEYDVLISQHPTEYKFAAKKYFSKFKDHAAVRLAKQLMNAGFGADYAANWIFQFSDFPAFEQSYEVNYPFAVLKLNQDTVEAFRKALIHFYRESKADSFLSGQKEFLDTMIARATKSFSKKTLPAIIEDYYGVYKNADFLISLSPLLHSGGYGIDRRDCKKNKNELIALIGPNGETEFVPTYDQTFIEQDLVIHEFGHSYANPIVDLFAASTNSLKSTLYASGAEQLSDEGITQNSYMYELIVRAVTVRIVANSYGEAAAEKLLLYEKSIGFNAVAEVADELKKYEKQRDKYPTLKDFYPEIIKGLGQIKK